MTRRAIFWCGLVEQHSLTRAYSRNLMTPGAGDTLMGAAQRESGSLLVVEQRRLPPHAIVTFNTSRDFRLRELFSVNVFVAVFALCGRRLEIDIDQFRFEIRWLVAVLASRSAMRTQQRERCL